MNTCSSAILAAPLPSTPSDEAENGISSPQTIFSSPENAGPSISYEGRLSVLSTSTLEAISKVNQENNIPLFSVAVDSDSAYDEELDKKSMEVPSSPYTEEEIEKPPYRCPKCDFVETTALDSFHNHMKEAHWDTSMEDEMDDDEIEDDDEDDDGSQGGTRPSSKAKSFKCKQCEYVSETKEDFWKHTKDHIKPEKLLACPKCPFVTEYKHHLEYHLRNHFGSKPFKCKHCNYTCVNKSMLNSHMKSHNNVYQYRCRDCSYATKYCHSLKLHLRKYSHKPDVVLNSDGTVNPLPVIDVYGTRRGPKPKKDENGIPVIPPFVVAQMQQQLQMQQQSSPQPVAAISPFNKKAKDKKSEEFKKVQKEEANESNRRQSYETDENQFKCLHCKFETSSSEVYENHITLHERMKQQESAPKSKGVKVSEESPSNPATNLEYFCKIAPLLRQSTVLETSPFRAYFENMVKTISESQKSEALDLSGQKEEDKETSFSKDGGYWQNSHICNFCELAFKDPIMHTIHMGYHGFSNPFKCNMCGEEAGDKLSFFMHVARKSHG